VNGIRGFSDISNCVLPAAVRRFKFCHLNNISEYRTGIKNIISRKYKNIKQEMKLMEIAFSGI
jgi:hypothetical protein